MKTTKLMALAATMVGMTAFYSCSNDEDAPNYGQGGTDGKAIRFAANSAQYSRAAADGVTTTEGLTEFAVYGYTEGEAFMKGVEVTKGADNNWTYSPQQYWPLNPSNFYAYSPVSWGANPEGAVDYYAEYGNTDLVYAVAMNQTQSNGPVVFNFRHALAQVILNLRTDVSDKLEIRVSHVSLENINTKGQFTFPSETTAAGSNVVGTWSGVSSPNTYLNYISGTIDDRMTLTSTAQETNVINMGLYVPQTLEPVTFDATSAQGTVAVVHLAMYDTTTGKVVWPNSTTPAQQVVDEGGFQSGILYFALMTDSVTAWEAGTRYIYTISVNEPSSLGYIEFGQPTVDSYTEVNVEPEVVE